MKILNSEKIHFFEENHYLCNHACNTTKCKCTKDIKKVTCLNCLREIKKGRYKKIDDNSENDNNRHPWTKTIMGPWIFWS